MELKDEDASEREQVNEEKLSFLQTQVKDILAVAEDHERKIQPLELSMDQLRMEIKEERSKVEKVKSDMEDMEALVGESITDDEDDFANKSEPKAVSAKETKRQEEEEPYDDVDGEDEQEEDDEDDDDEEED